MACLDAKGVGVRGREGRRRLILTDREIRLSIQEELIVIDPPPGPSAYSSTSLDLTLDGTLREFNDGEEGLDLVIDPAAPGYKFNKSISHVSSLKTIDANEGYRLAKGRLVLAWTKERVHLRSKARIAARVVHLPAGLRTDARISGGRLRRAIQWAVGYVSTRT